MADAGGAVSITGYAYPSFVQCEFTGNHAAGSLGSGGGALECGYSSRPRIDDCTFTNNSSGQYGGAILCYSAAVPALARCTLYGNSAPLGSAIHSQRCSTPELRNCIVAFGGGGEPLTAEDDCLPLLRCCDVYGNAGGDWVGVIADQYGIAGNISEDPHFCDELLRDFRLHAGSPCLPGANPACGLIGAWPIGCPSTDVAADSRACAAHLRVRPSPFADRTRFEYFRPDGASPSPAQLQVWDAGGRLVISLVAECRPGGICSAIWDGRDVRGRAQPGGVYFGRWVQEGEGVTRPVLLVR